MVGLAKILYINKGPVSHKINTERVESSLGGQYICDLSILDSHGMWTYHPVSVFWQPNPKPTHTHYFGIFIDDAGRPVICNALSAAEITWPGMVSDEGEIIFSRFRRDYRVSRDKSVSVDGGQDLFRARGKRFVKLRIDGPDFVYEE